MSKRLLFDLMSKTHMCFWDWLVRQALGYRTFSALGSECSRALLSGNLALSWSERATDLLLICVRVHRHIVVHLVSSTLFKSTTLLHLLLVHHDVRHHIIIVTVRAQHVCGQTVLTCFYLSDGFALLGLRSNSLLVDIVPLRFKPLSHFIDSHVLFKHVVLYVHFVLHLAHRFICSDFLETLLELGHSHT